MCESRYKDISPTHPARPRIGRRGSRALPRRSRAPVMVRRGATRFRGIASYYGAGMRCNFKPLMPISYLGGELGLIRYHVFAHGNVGWAAAPPYSVWSPPPLQVVEVPGRSRSASRARSRVTVRYVRETEIHIIRPRAVVRHAAAPRLHASAYHVAIIRPPAVVRHAAAPRLRWPVA